MTTLSVIDLATDKEMDRDTMAEVTGGQHDMWAGFGGFNVLSPQLYNKVTTIVGAVSAPTVQGNSLNQADYTNALNGNGSQFISNNKFGHQSNDNWISDIANPVVG